MSLAKSAATRVGHTVLTRCCAVIPGRTYGLKDRNLPLVPHHSAEKQETMKHPSIAAGTGIAMLVIAGIVDLAQTSGRPDAQTCKFLQHVDSSSGIGSIPSGCQPVNPTLAIVLALIGAALVIAAFIASVRRLP